MRAPPPLLLRRAPEGPSSEAQPTSTGGAWRFEDRPLVSGRPGDTIASALLAAGERMTGRSAKYRRPRGPYCLQGDCGTCLVRVDGRPNLRACMTPWRAGLSVERQNTYHPAGLDPTSLVDRVFRGGLDHHHLAVHPRIVNEAMQTLARQLTGFGEIPDPEVSVHADYVHHTPTVLVIGAGPAGRAVAAHLEAAGIEHLVVDRHDHQGLRHPPLEDPAKVTLPGALKASVGIFAAYELDDVWAGGHESLAAGASGPEVDTALHTFRAPHVVLATGARDPMIELVNNDLPGVVSARGLLRQLGRAGARLEGPALVIGQGSCAERCALALGVPRVDAADVARLEAQGGALAAVHLRPDARVEGPRRRACRLVALAPSPAPAHELAAQAGAELRFDGAGFAVLRDDDGIAARFNTTTVWAAGDVTGWIGPDAAAADGARVAERLIARLARGATGRVFAPVTVTPAEDK